MAVVDLQRMLAAHGFDCGTADGAVGPKTKAAVKRFQSAYAGPNGFLEIDGVIGPKTEAAIKWMQDTNSLVTYFSVDELRCHGKGCCGGAPYVKRELLSALFELRKKIGGPLKVLDAYRCPAHNKAVGGVGASQHMEGRAADLGTPVSLQTALSVNRFSGIGTRGNNASHVDVRTNASPSRPARWSYGR